MVNMSSIRPEVVVLVPALPNLKKHIAPAVKLVMLRPTRVAVLRMEAVPTAETVLTALKRLPLRESPFIRGASAQDQIGAVPLAFGTQKIERLIPALGTQSSGSGQ